MRRALLTLIVTACALVLVAAQEARSPQPAPLFEDKFDGKLADGWTWVREDKKHWRADNEGLHIRNQHGSLWGGGNDARNVLLRALPDAKSASLAIDVTVQQKPVINAEQAGLIYHVDDENYVKLIFEALEGKSWIVMAREVGGKGNMLGKVPLPSEAPRLRLVVAPDGIRGQFLGKDDKWEDVGKCEFPGDAAARKNARVGLVCHGGPYEVERWAKFNDFRIANEK
jgi:regulation of enolase protein 1 (concanavalin A-like superfamily)